MNAPKPGYLDGLLAAMVAVAEITGQQKLEGMSDREWGLIRDVNLKLAEMANEAAARLAAPI